MVKLGEVFLMVELVLGLVVVVVVVLGEIFLVVKWFEAMKMVQVKLVVLLLFWGKISKYNFALMFLLTLIHLQQKKRGKLNLHTTYDYTKIRFLHEWCTSHLVLIHINES